VIMGREEESRGKTEGLGRFLNLVNDVIILGLAKKRADGGIIVLQVDARKRVQHQEGRGSGVKNGKGRRTKIQREAEETRSGETNKKKGMKRRKKTREEKCRVLRLSGFVLEKKRRRLEKRGKRIYSVKSWGCMGHQRRAGLRRRKNQDPNNFSNISWRPRPAEERERKRDSARVFLVRMTVD